MYAKCLDCKNVFNVFSLNFYNIYHNTAIQCPTCGSFNIEISNGIEYLTKL